MAGRYGGTSEHAFITIGKDIKSNKIPRAVLLCGKERYLIEFYTDVLIKKFVSEPCRALDLITIEEDNVSLDSIVEGLETVSLMSERKVVLLKDFAPAAGGSLRGFGEDKVKALAGYIEKIPEGSLLIVTASDIEGKKAAKSKVREAIKKSGKVYDFQALQDSQLRSFIDKRLRTSGKSYKASVISSIIQLSGYDNKYIDYTLFNLDNDLRKVMAYSDRDEITVEDVKQVFSFNPENNIFAMIDEISRGHKGRALTLLHNLLESGENPYGILRMIAGQLELILSAKEMRDDGLNMAQMRKELGNIQEFRVKNALGFANKFSRSDLKKALHYTYQVDENIKTGIMEGPLALEFLIASL